MGSSFKSGKDRAVKREGWALPFICLTAHTATRLWETFTFALTLLHSEWPELYGVLAILSTIGLMSSYPIKHIENFYLCLNPIAHRMAKALWSLGHFEYNRVNMILPH